ncbi:MAG: CHAD domain-containing protein [Chloroflexi bacterium]|nr:CHAD domain-containing protein [Chloroflexota bacterium]
MEARALLIEALDARWKKFRAELKHCREEFSEEAVHDLRVATRRLLAIFDLLRAIIPHNRIQKVRRELKDQLDDLDDLRDTQALLADISEYLHEHPPLKLFQDHLLKEEKQLMRLARKLVRAREHTRLNKRVEKIQTMVQLLNSETLPGQMVAVADEVFARVMQACLAMDASSPASIHKLRIAFKRFRYTLEVIHPLLPNFPPANFERMQAYQACMGDIQDMEVASQRVTELDDASPSDLEAVSAHYASRLRMAILTFLEDKGEALVFWRASPEQLFPWEK